MRRSSLLLAIALALSVSACKSTGASSGPNPNMEALNAHYGISATDPRADYVPALLYYSDAPRPPGFQRSGALAQAQIAAAAPAQESAPSTG